MSVASGSGVGALTPLTNAQIVNPIPQQSDRLKQLLLVKTNIGGWFFDAFLKLNHTSTLTITEHPVETNASISDHAYMNPQELSIDIGMSDVAKSYVSGQFAGSWSRSVTAYQILREIQRQRLPVRILTRLGLYNNMMIQSITAPDDYMTLNGLKATINFRELLVGTVQTVKISARPQTTDSTNKGNVEPQQPDVSALERLKQAGGSLFGL